MKRKGQTTFAARAIAVYLSLNVEVMEQPGARLLTFPLVSLSWLLMLLWRTRCKIGGWQRAFHREWQWIQAQTTILLTVTGIGIRSLLYGMGVPV